MYVHPRPLLTLRKGLTYRTAGGREGRWQGVRYAESGAVELRDTKTGQRFKASTEGLQLVAFPTESK